MIYLKEKKYAKTFSSKIYPIFCVSFGVCWRPSWKKAVTAARGQLVDGYTSRIVHTTLVNLYAKFNAFIKKGTIGLSIQAKLLENRDMSS